MSKASPSQQQIKNLFKKGAILYIPELGLIFGVNEGIILSQLLYWRGKGHRRDNSFYNTQTELYLETGLSRDKQDRAIKKLKSYGFLETKNKGVPQKRHFYIDVDMLTLIIIKLLETNEFRDLEIGSGFAGFQQSITEITHKVTTKITPESTSHYENPHGRTQSIAEIMGNRFLEGK